MKFTASLCLAGVSLVSLAVPAFAQSADPAAGSAQESAGEETELVVTARRREESVQDVPQTVNVVTAQQIENLNLRSFQEIQSVVPGLTMTQTSAFSSSATVRGVAFVPEASGNNPSVEFYLNDAPISSGFLFQSTFDFGQFELQRGPQGTLRGRAAPSGAIAVTVRRPDLSQVGVVVNGTATDQHAYKLDGAFNIPIIQDMLAIRLAGVIDRSRGNFVHSTKQISDPLNNEDPFRHTTAIRGSVRFEPTDTLAFNVMYQELHSLDHSYTQIASDSLFTGAVRTTPLIRPFDRLSNDDQGSYNRQKHQVLVGNADFSFAGQKLSYVGSYSKQDFGVVGGGDAGDFFAPPRVATKPRVLVDPAGYEAVAAGEMLRSGYTATTGAYFQSTHGVAKRETHELRLASEERIGGIFDYVVGVYYDHNNNPTNLTQETPIVIGGNVAVVSLTAIQRRGQSTEKSAFGNVTAHLGPVELSGGLRYIDYRNTNSLATATPPGLLTTLVNQADKLNATIYTASAKYQVTPDIMVYALTGSSWRPGPRVIGDFSVGPTGTEGPSARERSFLNLPPETSKSYEIGFKSGFFDNRARLNVSAYYQKFKNYPFRGPAAYFISYTNTAGVISGAPTAFNFVAPVPVKVKGIEAEASFRIADWWTVSANASYADGKISNATIPCTDLNGDGKPDTNVVAPTLAQLQAAVGAGQTLSQCTGVNQRSLNSPKFNANLQTEFRYPLFENVDTFLRGSTTIAGRTANDPNNTFDDIGAYGITNVFLGARASDGSWEVTLFAKNLLNERKILNVGSGPLVTSVRTPAVTNFVSEYRSVSVTAPREFGLTAKIALGSR